jgi:signal transduction histidine kinase/ActR/RegA family two-component response regulator
MTLSAAFAIASAALGLAIAGFVLRIARAPGWEDQRPLSFAALTAGAATLANAAATIPIATASAVLLSRCQMLFIGLHVAAWHHYANRVAGRPPVPLERAAPLIAGAAAASALVPGLVYLPTIRVHQVAILNLTYYDSVTTSYGNGLMAFYALLGTWVLLRFVGAMRRGVPWTGLPLVGLVFLQVIAVHDALVNGGILESPYLLDFGFLAPIAAVSFQLQRRFTADATALRELRTQLERKVDERSKELARTAQALSRAEKLAALGQLSAGVAHELNNPTAAVAANLEFVQSYLETAGAPQDALDAVRESRESIARVAHTVRELLDAGRAAAAPEERVPVSLASVAESAVREAQARFGNRVRLADLVPSGLHALGQERALVHVVGHLVANGVQAVPPGKRDGQVVLRGEREGARARLVIEDNGAGMTEETLERLFEPFFTTRAFGAGTGLGLAVSRGLLGSLGGDLRLESREGHGTRAIVELDAAEAPRPRAAGETTGELPLAPAEPRALRRRLLVVDDEPVVLSSLRRLLGRRYEVSLAFSVEEARRALAREAFDLVLCDVTMPDGGGTQLWKEVRESDAYAAGRFVFLTGGALSDEARRFLDTTAQPVLEKPLDLERLAAAEERILGVREPTAWPRAVFSNPRA